MKRHLTVTPDNKPAGVRMILANRKGYILYDIEKDRNKKPPTGGRDPKAADQRNRRQYNTKDG